MIFLITETLLYLFFWAPATTLPLAPAQPNEIDVVVFLKVLVFLRYKKYPILYLEKYIEANTKQPHGRKSFIGISRCIPLENDAWYVSS